MFDFIVNYIFLFLLIISVLVTIHELGHYWAARLFKIKIGAFAVGLGPIIWKKISRSPINEIKMMKNESVLSLFVFEDFS